MTETEEKTFDISEVLANLYSQKAATEQIVLEHQALHAKVLGAIENLEGLKKDGYELNKNGVADSENEE